MTPGASFLRTYKLDTRPIVALLPGSRVQEVRHIAPVLCSLVPEYPQYQWCLSCARPELYHVLQRSVPSGLQSSLCIIRGDTHQLLLHASFAILASGTASMEAALLNVPQIVCYRMTKLNYLIARRLIRVPYISLVNLQCGRAVVPELIQDQFTSENLRAAFDAHDTPEGRARQREGYVHLRAALSGRDVSLRIAQAIISG